MATCPTSIRLTPEIERQIEDLIDSGEFGNRTEFIMYAIRMTLKNYSGRLTPPPPLRRRGGPTIDGIVRRDLTELPPIFSVD